jgi:hypothetical protein
MRSDLVLGHFLMCPIATSSVNWLARQPVSFTSRTHGCRTPPTKVCAALRLPILEAELARSGARGPTGGKAPRRLTASFPRTCIVGSGIGSQGQFPFLNSAGLPGASSLQFMSSDDGIQGWFAPAAFLIACPVFSSWSTSPSASHHTHPPSRR